MLDEAQIDMKGKSSLPNTQVNGLTVAMYPGGQDTVSWGAVWRVERGKGGKECYDESS